MLVSQMVTGCPFDLFFQQGLMSYRLALNVCLHLLHVYSIYSAVYTNEKIWKVCLSFSFEEVDLESQKL